jgi:uncharacterized protein (DUF488 family)
MSKADGGHPRTVWTVGHSNHPLDRFLGLLRAHEIEAIADVRSQPYSRHTPHFSRDALRASVTDAGLRYLFMGRELGGRPADPYLYDEEGRVRYDTLAATPRFRAGLSSLLAAAACWRVALLCAEEDPTSCHRRLLVGRVLARQGVRVRHIRVDGQIVDEVGLDAAGAAPVEQLRLFSPEGGEAWRSTRSVSRGGRRTGSSRR